MFLPKEEKLIEGTFKEHTCMILYLFMYWFVFCLSYIKAGESSRLEQTRIISSTCTLWHVLYALFTHLSYIFVFGNIILSHNYSHSFNQNFKTMTQSQYFIPVSCIYRTYNILYEVYPLIQSFHSGTYYGRV